MPRPLASLLAILALLCAAPHYAQDSPPPDRPGDPILGTWMGIEMAGEEMPEGEFMIAFHADGTGEFGERGMDPDAFTFVRDDHGRIYTLSMAGEEAFSFEATFDGDTVTLDPADDDGPPQIVLRRVAGADDDAPVDMSDSPLVGRWALVSFNGEALPDDVVYVFENHADGRGTSTQNGEPGEAYSWQHDFETGIATFTHPGQEPAAFTFVIEGDLATYVSTDESMTIVERRVHADEPPNGVPAPEPAPVDTSDSPLLGRWMLIQFNGELVPEGVVAYDHHADGTGTVIENGEEGASFGWNHDVDSATVTVETAEGDVMTFAVVMVEDLAVYFSEANGGMRIVQRRVDAAGPAAITEAMIGTWMGVSMGGELLEPGDLVLTFNADGTGALDDGGDEDEPFEYAYNSATKLYSITVDGEDPIIFAVTIDGEELTLTPVEEDGPSELVLRRVAEEDARDDAGAMDADGVVGTWYAQKMEGEWVPVDDEFRIEFREDGTAAAYENGDLEDDVIHYVVDETRSVIQIYEQPGGELEIELEYEMFDDVMVLTIQPPPGFDDGFGGADEMVILLCRRPEGTEDHQRERAAAGGADRDDVPVPGRDAPEGLDPEHDHTEGHDHD